MTPAARVQSAIEVLDQILGGMPAEQALTGWARRSRFAGSKDRAALRDHVYDVLRRRRSALPAGLAETGRNLMLGLLAQDGSDLEALFSGHGYGPQPLTAQERAALTGARDAGPSPEAPDLSDLSDLSVVPDVPDWIVPLLQQALRDEYPAMLRGLGARAPVFLRVNLRKARRDSAIAALGQEQISTQISTLSDSALEVVEGARRIATSRAYRDGLVELQDASSQAAMACLPLVDGMRILDFCAGGGGKTLAMGGRVDADFVAHDALAARLRDLPARAERADLGVRISDLAQLERDPPFDLVLCDVPCSGSGTWRRTPDAKWRFEPGDLDELIRVQQEILLQAQRFVAPGGMLAYATCSLLQEENEDQVAAFLAANPGWSCVASQRWSPLDGCDGFFLAQLTREAGSS